MDAAVVIPLPLAHVGSVNAWLLRGDPITLIDTGPRDDGALAALEAGLRRYGLRVEDIELLLATHHHLDHVGLAATIQRRSGATVAVLDRTAEYAARYSAEVEEDRRFAHALMRHHGVPEPLIEATEEFWDYIRATTESFEADVRLADGDRVQAGGRSLRVVARPGHSTTDTLFVDDRDAIAFAGDHLLATISSNTEICPPDRARDGRARSRLRYLANLELTAGMPLARLLTGHGAPVTEHERLVAARLDDHRRRCERILAILDGGPRTAFEIARAMWPARTVTEQPLLVVWEVVGNLELLLAAGAVAERVGGGSSVFELTAAGRAAPRSVARRRRARRPECAGRR
jgi:glyoxylase-like metal-dependent hydrolase (beta-lactamase superfamily II)